MLIDYHDSLSVTCYTLANCYSIVVNVIDTIDILLQGRRTSASVMVANMTDPEGDQPGQGGSKGLYSLFWQLRGDLCAVRTDFRWGHCDTPMFSLYPGSFCSHHITFVNVVHVRVADNAQWNTQLMMHVWRKNVQHLEVITQSLKQVCTL